MSELKCPFCQQELRPVSLFTNRDKRCVWYCPNCATNKGLWVMANERVWQELIRTRENLQKANAELDYIKEQVEKSNAFIHARIKVAAEQIARGIIDQVKIIKEQKD